MTLNPSLRLSPLVYAAAAGRDLVLLDVRRDRYFCLPQVGALDAGRLAAGDLADLPPRLQEGLRDAGLARPGLRAARPDLTYVAPARDLLASAETRPTPGEVLAFCGAAASLLGTFRGRPFSRLLLLAAHRRLRLCEVTPAVETAAARRAGAFAQLMPWSPVQGACLMQAALCLAYLAQIGLAADWVFGVRTWPFSAHCWVQAGDLVLSDSVERVAPYSPILKV